MKDTIIISPAKVVIDFSQPTPYIRTKKHLFQNKFSRNPAEKMTLIVEGVDWFSSESLPPQNFQATNGFATWDAVDESQGYNVYHSLDGENFTKFNGELIQTLSADLSGLPDGDYIAFVTSVRIGRESAPSNTDTFSLQSVFPWIIMNDANSRAWTFDRETGAELFFYDQALGAGSRHVMAIDGLRGFLYSMNKSEELRKFSLNLITGEVNTTPVWMVPFIQSTSDSPIITIDAAGDLYISLRRPDIDSTTRRLQKISQIDGSVIWVSEAGQGESSHGGIAAHPTLGILTMQNTLGPMMEITDPANGALLNLVNLKHTDGSLIPSSDNLLDPVVGVDGFIYIIRHQGAFQGVYRIDPATFDSTHFITIPGEGGRFQFLTPEHMVVGNGSSSTYLTVLTLNNLTNVTPGLFRSRLSDTLTNATKDDVYHIIDRGNYIFFVDTLNSDATTCINALTGEVIWVRPIPFGFTRMTRFVTAPGRANPFMV